MKTIIKYQIEFCVIVTFIAILLNFLPINKQMQGQGMNESYAKGTQVVKSWDGNAILFYDRILTESEIKKLSNLPKQAKAI